MGLSQERAATNLSAHETQTGLRQCLQRRVPFEKRQEGPSPVAPMITPTSTVSPSLRKRSLSVYSRSSDDSTHGYDVIFEDVENETVFPQVNNETESCTTITRRSRLYVFKFFRLSS